MAASSAKTSLAVKRTQKLSIFGISDFAVICTARGYMCAYLSVLHMLALFH